MRPYDVFCFLRAWISLQRERRGLFREVFVPSSVSDGCVVGYMGNRAATCLDGVGGAIAIW